MQIEMIQRRFGYFPLRFSIHGKEHHVNSVARCRTTGTQNEIKRHYFDVVCDDGDYTIYQDLKNNTWHVVNRRRANKSLPATDKAEDARWLKLDC